MELPDEGPRGRPGNQSAADTRDLAALRAQIDALDEQLLTLVRQRLALAGSVAKAKRQAGDTGFGLRPAREIAIYRRLMTQCHDAAEAETVAAVWRTLMAANLRRQGPLRVVAAAGACTTLARVHYGDCAEIDVAPVGDVVASLNGHPFAVGVLPYPAEDRIVDPWWAHPFGDKLHIVGALPIVADGNPTALVLANLANEPAGNDVTLVCMPSEVHTTHLMIARTNGNTLIAVPGFLTQETARTMLGVGPNDTTVRVLGSYARA